MPNDRTQSVTEVFLRYNKDIRSFLRQRLPSVEDVEDLTQEAFVRVNRIKNWQQVDNPRNYLFQIVKNLFRDHMRKQQRNIVCSGRDLEISKTESPAPTPEEALQIDQEFSGLCAAITRLPPKAQRALILNKFFGHTYEETGRVMGISPRTVEKHIAKGVAECQRHMLRHANRHTADRVVPFAAKDRSR